MKTCIYLRKSRADEELEKINPGNTLNRHKDTLIKIAEEKKLSIVKIHEEIASGESLNQRPAMLQLLEEVGNNEYDAVLIMDMDRLGRGNMQEQGLILETFKQSRTKIITPRKTYDLEDEFDEEYSEFEAFMARKELKIINRRMQRGRLKSIEEGNYIGTYAPFGYKLNGQGKNRTLEIEPENAAAVKLIFDQYASGLGGNKIATKLNAMGYKSATGKQFSNHAIINIIKNPIYIGKVTWKKKSTIKGDLNKRRTVKLNPKDEWIVCDGKHEPIISKELFEACQFQLQNKTHVPYNVKLTNPLAGLVLCSGCRKPMSYRPYLNVASHLVCQNQHCKVNKSSRFDLIENRILDQLSEELNHYKVGSPIIPEEDKESSSQMTSTIKAELSKLESQKERLHDLLEQGIYDIDTFLNRSEIITDKINKLNEQLNELNKKKPALSDNDKAEIISSILYEYTHCEIPELKNQLLKELIEYVEYSKPKDVRNPNGFKLYIKLRI